MFRGMPAYIEVLEYHTDKNLLQGKIFVRGDSKVFRFRTGKSESLFAQRKNPRRIAWTVLFRRQHRKGISEVRLTPSDDSIYIYTRT